MSRIVVLSVHTDDGIFSIGAHLAALNAEITIASPFAGIPCDEAGRLKHTTLRAEHDAACAVIGVEAVNGAFLDDVYPAPRRSEVSQWLAGQLVGADRAYLPFGIFHPDHLLTSNLLLDLIRLLPEIPAKLYFFEELPYRVNYPEAANNRFAHIENTIGRLRLLEEVNSTDVKERAVRMYQSQTDEALIPKLLVRERIWELVR